MIVRDDGQGLTGADPVAVPPPPGFRPAVEVHSPHFEGREAAATGFSAAQVAGARYERQVLSIFSERYDGQFRRTPVIRFHDGMHHRSIIPDGIIFPTPNFVVIVEIKYQHMPEAWWQLRRLYQPVLQTMYPRSSICVLEVCRSFDPHTPFPEPTVLVDEDSSFLSSSFQVLRWKKKKF